MKMPGKRWGCVLVGLIIQVPVLLLFLGAVFDMHNRFSVLVSVLLPYAAITDRFSHPPLAFMMAMLLVTVLQYPLYGAAIGNAWAKGKLLFTLTGVTAVHAIATVIAIYMKMAKV
jgi:hypothetical protein